VYDANRTVSSNLILSAKLNDAQKGVVQIIVAFSSWELVRKGRLQL
jgi:hypothetical protein